MKNRIIKIRRSRSGFGLLDVMIASVIMFTGAMVMISILPNLTKIQFNRTSSDVAIAFADSKKEELLAAQWSSIAAGPITGDFNSLLPLASDKTKYSWEYTSTVVQPGLLKKVILNVNWGNSNDTYVFYAVDLKND